MSACLGKPSLKIINWCKDHYGTFDGDIFTKYNGDIVKVPYDGSKTSINITNIEDYENIINFSFGKSYTEIDNLEYNTKSHGIDLSRTSLDEMSFYSLDLSYTNLISFQLPSNLSSFGYLDLMNNQLTSLSLPNALISFNTLFLNDNQLTSLSLPISLIDFDSLYLNSNCILDMTHIINENQIPTINEYGIITDGSIENTIIKIKDASMESVFKTRLYWEDYQYTWDGKRK